MLNESLFEVAGDADVQNTRDAGEDDLTDDLTHGGARSCLNPLDESRRIVTAKVEPTGIRIESVALRRVRRAYLASEFFRRAA